MSKEIFHQFWRWNIHTDRQWMPPTRIHVMCYEELNYFIPSHIKIMPQLKNKSLKGHILQPFLYTRM